jgi:hypothetical protein
MEFLKNNSLTIVVIILLLIIIFLDNRHKPINSITPILNRDSIESSIKEQYRVKLDSAIKDHNTKIIQLKAKNKKIEKDINNLDSIIGQLPDFK